MTKKVKILKAQNSEVTFFTQRKDDYISLTDIARYRDADRSDYILQNWLRDRSTIEFIGLWEQLNNPSLNSIEFDGFKNEAGSNSFSLTPKRWIEATNAVGLVSKAGRYGGTYAHRDIAFEFASWIGPKLYFISGRQFIRVAELETTSTRLSQSQKAEFTSVIEHFWLKSNEVDGVYSQRLKKEEQQRHSLEWNVSRTLAKVNYRIHTDAIKEHLIPPKLQKQHIAYVY